jgi:glycosyltransferase involved in cell wall biosynthesis
MAERRTLLQLVHGYNAPFFDLSNQYGAAFDRTQWRVVTVFLTGKADAQLQQRCNADEVVFLQLRSRDLGGLKLAAIARVKAVVARVRPQLVIAQRYKPLYIALFATLATNTPVLGVAHAFGVMRQRARRWLMGCFGKRLLLAGVSDAVADDMRKAFGAGRGPRIVSLPNAIDADAAKRELLPRDGARDAMRLPRDALIFGNVGRLHPDKDQATLVRAFATIAPHCREAMLVLVGDGRDRDALRHLITQLGMEQRIVLFGPLAHARRYFRAFDIYVSASDREPFGIVLLEAMAAALPVISTDCGGAPQVLGRAALYFGHGDSAALAAHLRTACEWPAAKRRAVGIELQQQLREFDVAAFAERLHAVLGTLL